jgi:hypothetical protein
MREEHSFYIDELSENCRISKFSNELEEFLPSDLKNLENFLLIIFDNSRKFILENIDPTFSPKIEVNLIFQAEKFDKIKKENEKTTRIKEQTKRKLTAFHVGNNLKGTVFINVEERLSVLKHGYPTFILNIVMTFFHEILHCCYLNLRTEQEIFDLECSLVEKFLEIDLPKSWKTQNTSISKKLERT